MKLLAVRSLEFGDPLPTLGRKVTPKTKAILGPPAWVWVKDDLWQAPDGKLSTFIGKNDFASLEETHDLPHKTVPGQAIDLCKQITVGYRKLMDELYGAVPAEFFGTSTGRVSMTAQTLAQSSGLSKAKDR